MPTAARIARGDFQPELSPFEKAFVRTVREHRRLLQEPTLAEFSCALDVLRRFDQQRQDNPPSSLSGLPELDPESTAALHAKAFLMFGVTKPTSTQWHKAYAALFGPLLCETCE